MKEYVVKDDGDVMMVGGKIMRELVRCKDCKYWESEDEQDKQPSWLPCVAIQTRSDFFCADGESKEGR
jgi:hypothetical protein